MISVYNRLTETELNLRRLESMEQYNRLIQWGRANPTRFIEEIFKVQLLDYQKWVILGTWTAEQAVWVCSRNAGKSFLGALYIGARALLFPKQNIFIMSNTGSQAKDTFLKLENFAKKNISSLIGSSDVFFSEVVRNASNTDGFVHGHSSYELELYNGSKVTSLVGKATNVVGKRSNLNFYDEAGKIDAEYFALTRPFTTQNMDFKTGAGFDAKVYPKDIPTQNIYASSAEGVDSYLWQQYKDCAQNMLMGIPGYFCADINCDLPLRPSVNGVPVAPLLKQSEIDSSMRANEARALREYYNIFDTSGGSDAAVQRPVILRNEKTYLPVDQSVSDDKFYVICYDPALQADNSFVLIGELFEDPEKGWMGRIVNGINLIERLGPTDKRPLRTPEQIEWIKKIVLAYNGGAPEYENIKLCIDAGSGGGGRQYADLLIPDWKDAAGNTHRGMVDAEDEFSTTQYKKFPHACNCVRLIEPTKFKSIMYTAMSEMMQQDLIELPPSLPRDGIMHFEDDTSKTLTSEETRALLEIDLMKEEVMAIQKKKTAAGNIVYSLPPSKEKKMHDDRAYCLAMFGWVLSEKRREMFKIKEKNTATYADYLASVRAPAKNANPWGARGNPFASKKNPFVKG